jgi:hypothetical protein
MEGGKKSNLKIQAVLVLFVVLIWGGVAVRFVNLKNNRSNSVNELHDGLGSRPDQFDSTTLFLGLNYPDPFFPGQQIDEKSMEYRSIHDRNQVNISKLAQNSDAVISPVAFKYKGYSKGNDGVLRARILVNGKGGTYLIGQQNAGIRLISVTLDTAIIEYNKIRLALTRR